MGVVEEGGKVAEGFLSAFRGQPFGLALVVTNLALIFLFYVILNTVAVQREREFTQLHSEQKEIREILSHCVIPQQKTEVPAWLASLMEGDFR